MEKKKLLIVAVSVGVVLLIMIGVPLMILSNQSPATPPMQAVYQERDAIDRFAAQQRPDARQQEELGQQVADALAEIDDLNLPSRVTMPAPSAAPEAEAEAPAATTITVPTPRTAAVPDTPPAERPAPARAATPAPAPAARTTPPPAVVAAQPARPAAQAARPAAPAATRPAAAATRSNFWVQTGAFSSNARAESVKESLESKGIVSIIENRNVDGRTLYRVRVGPYLSETEANYWLALVRSIDGFADSQVRVSQVPVN